MGLNLKWGMKMAPARVYRHDVRCPDVGPDWMLKDGLAGGRPAGLPLWGLPAMLSSRRGLPPSERCGEGSGHQVIPGGQQYERRRADVGLQPLRIPGFFPR